MHAKVTVADDVVFLGSFNLSRSGEMNAENVLEIADPALAERLAAWIDGLRARYRMGSERRLGALLVAGGCLPFAAGALADRDGGGLLPPCPFRSLTGLPCPFCGATRAFALAVRGDCGLAQLQRALGRAGGAGDRGGRAAAGGRAAPRVAAPGRRRRRGRARGRAWRGPTRSPSAARSPASSGRDAAPGTAAAGRGVAHQQADDDQPEEDHAQT